MPAVNSKGVPGALGDKLICTTSMSPGYKVGKTYEVVADAKGTLGLWGSDGFFDPLGLICSSFMKVVNDPE